MLTVRPRVSDPSSGSNNEGFIVLVTTFVQQTDETSLGLVCATDSASAELLRQEPFDERSAWMGSSARRLR